MKYAQTTILPSILLLVGLTVLLQPIPLSAFSRAQLARRSADRVQVGQPPYPSSTYIMELRWASLETVQRAALGSDSWTFTWADDGALYGAYGDGWGFEPHLDQKLSLGYVKVDGSADAFSGVNIRSDGEKTGDGWKGIKPAGLLMVDGTLYLWARNAGADGQECQLAQSTDYAQTWIWSDWHFAEFGYCTFINYGQNYNNATDGYVYMTSHDSPHAYSSADRFILARVPKTQITERNAYEFLQTLDESGQPIWTPDVNQRGGVFEHAGKAWRSSIVYNSAIQRYLWWQGHQPSTSTEEEPGFGIYEAPELWGPWSSVYYTEKWDMSSGDIGLFPTKWMSDDGRTINLITSADDAFAVRQAVLVLAGDETPTPTVTLTPTAAPPTATPQPSLTTTPTGAAPTSSATPGTMPTVTATAVLTSTPTGQPPLGQQDWRLYLPIVQQ